MDLHHLMIELHQGGQLSHLLNFSYHTYLSNCVMIYLTLTCLGYWTLVNGVGCLRLFVDLGQLLQILAFLMVKHFLNLFDLLKYQLAFLMVECSCLHFGFLVVEFSLQQSFQFWSFNSCLSPITAHQFQGFNLCHSSRIHHQTWPYWASSVQDFQQESWIHQMPSIMVI